MGVLKFGFFVAAASVGVYMVFLSGDCPTPPALTTDGWWGRGSNQTDEDTSIRPFKIEIHDDVIVDLKTRLARTRFGEDLEDTQFQYGFQSKYLKEIVKYWQTAYDWRKQEEELNKFHHFKTKIEGIDIHFVRIKPVRANKNRPARVILITHGWPGSVWEFYKLIPRLTGPAKYGGRDEDAFEVICPSLPGYGFSEAPHQQGFSGSDAARIFHKLMARIGHDKYYVQGEDWGSLVSTIMAQAYPRNVLGVHLSSYAPPFRSFTPVVKQVVSLVFPSIFLHPEEQKHWKGFEFTRMLRETGYFHLQATKPDTVAAALTDSPAGLAAYILEKFSSWTKWDNRDLPDGGLTKKFTLDELLTNVMIYWVQGNVAPSMRFYKEWILSKDTQAFDLVPVDVPTGLAAVPNEFLYLPKAFVTGKYRNIVQFTHFPRGGHFTAFEEPELIANDIISFVRKVEALVKVEA